MVFSECGPVERPYDAILVVSFGGPEKTADVLPFLENVLRGKNVPRERMLEVAEHYYQFGGRSPINDQNRALIKALEAELAESGPRLPVYWGNRNWHPLLAQTLRTMSAQGIRRALAFVTSPYSSYSGCRQYREDIARAEQDVGPSAPAVEKLRAFYNHPGFIEALTDRVRAALDQIPCGLRSGARIVYTAHSIPISMAETSRYEAQLREACRLVSAASGLPDYQLVFQSRSGPPAQPWLEPDIRDYLRILASSDPVAYVVIVPIGFISDHMEVRFDLDVEARQLCQELGLNMIRAATVGTHPAFVKMIRELIVERVVQLTGDCPARRALGNQGPSHDYCPVDCCPRKTGP